MYEGRRAMRGFWSRQYVGMHADLSAAFGQRYALAVRHFLRNGVREGRIGVVGGSPLERVGIFYLGWHGLASSAQRYVAAWGGQPGTVADVLARRGRLADLLESRGLLGHAGWFHYQQTPQAGFYSLYRRRPGAAPYVFGGVPVLDSADTAGITRRHADQLTAARIDYVAVDSTNLPSFSDSADVLELRPLEVLFEEWAAWRQAGRATPQIAVWAAIPTGADLYLRYLDLYNQPSYQGLVLRDPYSGKKVFFAVDRDGMRADPAIVAAVQCNTNGAACRNDVVVVKMWGLSPQATLAQGAWDWMAPCRGPSGGFVTSIDAGTPCNQAFTAGSPIGSALSVSSSYQIYYASLPGGASGSRGGLTMKKQFDRAFALHPDYLFVNEWNELVAQPQPNTGHPAAISMGLEHDQGPSAVNGRSLWVDGYGAGFSRDIEPTTDRGTLLYDTLGSCLRVYRSGRARCDVGEACCQRDDDLFPMWSLRLREQDSLLTPNRAERDALVGGGVWRELCAPFGAWLPFCGGGADAGSGAGPFYTSRWPVGPALLRCLTANGHHFFSTSPTCEGQRAEGPIGYVASAPTVELPRPLVRCFNPATGMFTHTFLGSCPSGYGSPALIGYVR
jgi:hypothetical protein